MPSYILQYGPWFIGIVIVVGGYLWRKDHAQIVAWYDAHTTAKQRETIAQDIAIIKPLAEAAVPYVEQFFAGLPGEQKFTKAVEHVITILGHRGIAPDPLQVRAAVQKAYATAKVDGTLAASAPKSTTTAS